MHIKEMSRSTCYTFPAVYEYGKCTSLPLNLWGYICDVLLVHKHETSCMMAWNVFLLNITWFFIAKFLILWSRSKGKWKAWEGHLAWAASALLLSYDNRTISSPHNPLYVLLPALDTHLEAGTYWAHTKWLRALATQARSPEFDSLTPHYRTIHGCKSQWVALLQAFCLYFHFITSK